jgi:hypothetical protein
MRSRLLSICICLALAWLSGCAHCRARHAAPDYCLTCEPCGCDAVSSAEYVGSQPALGVPIPTPSYQAIPGPIGGIPGPAVGVIPVPPRR